MLDGCSGEVEVWPLRAALDERQKRAATVGAEFRGRVKDEAGRLKCAKTAGVARTQVDRPVTGAIGHSTGHIGLSLAVAARVWSNTIQFHQGMGGCRTGHHAGGAVHRADDREGRVYDIRRLGCGILVNAQAAVVVDADLLPGVEGGAITLGDAVQNVAVNLRARNQIKRSTQPIQKNAGFCVLEYVVERNGVGICTTGNVYYV